MAGLTRAVLRPLKPSRRSPRQTRFHSHRGRRSSEQFLAHRSGYPPYPAFRAHATRAIRAWKQKPVTPAKAAKAVKYKSEIKKVPAVYKGRKTPARYPSLIKTVPSAYKIRKTSGKYKPAR